MNVPMRIALFVAASVAAALAGTPAGQAQAVSHQVAPAAWASGRPSTRAGIAVPASVPEALPSPGILLVNQSFSHSKTPPDSFLFIDQACLTAGSGRANGSVPPCGSLAPRDRNGSGALENTDTQTYVASWVAYAKPLSTAFGLEISFTIYSFDGNSADGQLLYFTDASAGQPNTIGRYGGNLGYTSGYGLPGLSAAYLGIGFDESGMFSENDPTAGLNGGAPQRIPETITARGAVSTGYYYLGGALNAEGQPASLPFDWDTPGSPQRPATGPTVFVTLSPNGYVTCSVDIHDGHGFVNYYSEQIVGVNGQPAVPPYVYVGVTGSSGGGYNRHQIEDFMIWQG